MPEVLARPGEETGASTGTSGPNTGLKKEATAFGAATCARGAGPIEAGSDGAHADTNGRIHNNKNARGFCGEEVSWSRAMPGNVA